MPCPNYCESGYRPVSLMILMYWIVLDWMVIRVIDVSKCPNSAVSMKFWLHKRSVSYWRECQSTRRLQYPYMSVCFLTERQSDGHVSQLSLICCCSPQEANRRLFIWLDLWQLDPKWKSLSKAFVVVFGRCS